MSITHDVERALLVLKRVGKDPTWPLRMRRALAYRSIAREILSVHKFSGYRLICMGGLKQEYGELIRNLLGIPKLWFAQLQGIDECSLAIFLSRTPGNPHAEAAFTIVELEKAPAFTLARVIADLRSQLRFWRMTPYERQKKGWEWWCQDCDKTMFAVPTPEKCRYCGEKRIRRVPPSNQEEA